MGHVITTRDPYQMAAKVLKLPMPIVGRQLAFTISSPQYKYFWQDIKYHHSPNFGRPKQGQTFVVPTFHIHFMNPECVRIPWVLAPKKFPGTERFTKKIHFSLISVSPSKKKVSGSCTHNFDATDLPNS